MHPDTINHMQMYRTIAAARKQSSEYSLDLINKDELTEPKLKLSEFFRDNAAKLKSLYYINTTDTVKPISQMIITDIL